MSLVLGQQFLVPIRADGHCVYHLANTISLLLRDPSLLREGVAPCFLPLVQETRERTVRNFEAWRRSHLATLVSEPDIFGDELQLRQWEADVRGSQWGDNVTLSLCLASENIRVYVMMADRFYVENSCESLGIFLNFPATAQVVCAVRSADGKHYDLGVVPCAHNGVRAVFSAAEWPSCRKEIFQHVVKAKIALPKWQPLPALGVVLFVCVCVCSSLCYTRSVERIRTAMIAAQGEFICGCNHLRNEKHPFVLGRFESVEQGAFMI
jgi:hypothetical protein